MKVFRTDVLRRNGHDRAGAASFMASLKRRAAAVLGTAAAAAACATTLAIAPIDASAQQAGFPNKPIRFIVPYAPGGSSDVIVRSLLEPVGVALGQPIVFDYRPGGGGTVGMTMVAQSAPDGYTLGFGNTSPNTIAPVLQRSLAYDAITGFQPVSLVAEMPVFFVVNSQSPIKNFKEFVAAATKAPGAISYGTTGVGSFSNITGEMFAREVGAQLVHVPFKGSQEAATELLTGRIDSMLIPYLDIAQHVKAGKLRPLAVTSSARHPLLPDVPTVAEFGLPRLEATGWFGVLMPGGTPKPIVDRFHAEIVAASKLESFRTKTLSFGFVPVISSPEQLAARIKSDLEKWGAVVKSSGIKID